MREPTNTRRQMEALLQQPDESRMVGLDGAARGSADSPLNRRWILTTKPRTLADWFRKYGERETA